MDEAQRVVDYSLYLVTDTTEAILGKHDLRDIVEQAIKGGLLRSSITITITYQLMLSLRRHDCPTSRQTQ